MTKRIAHPATTDQIGQLAQTLARAFHGDEWDVPGGPHFWGMQRKPR